MERLVIYDAHELDCSGLYQLASEDKSLVVGERTHTLSVETADETATMVAVFVGSQVNRRVLARMPNLRLVMALSTGTNHIDLAECTARGITVCNVPAYGEQTVAEYALALMLSLGRRLPEATARLREGGAAHADLVGMDLAGKTLTVIGTGHIGLNLIKYARALSMKVLAVDPYPNQAAAAEYGFTYEGLHDGLRQADIVSLHAPLTPDTRGLINRHSLALMKPGAYLINTARGELVNTTALLHALHTGHLGGAGLDVIENEAVLGGQAEMTVLADGSVKPRVVRDIAEHEALLQLPNVILTNHNAYNTHEAQARITQSAVATIRAFLAGRPTNVIALKTR